MSKVVEYEKFINDRLKVDLKKVLEDLDVIYTEIAEYLQIKSTLEKINRAKTVNSASGHKEYKALETKVDLGCNFYANAIVDDPSRIFIAIHYGFYLEMTHDEAFKFIEKKVKLLNGYVDELKSKEAEIKANIKFVLEGLREIQNLNFSNETNKNSLFV
jgi:prefoldin subunit 5